MAHHEPTPYPIEIETMEGNHKEMDEMMALGKRAFGPNPLLEFCFNQRPGVTQDITEARTKQHMKRIADPQFLYRKAVDPSQLERPIVGVAVWYWQMDPQNEREEDPWGPWPEGVNLECLDACLGTLRRWRAKHFRERNTPYLYLCILETDPSFQRRGVGSALLRDGLDRIDSKGMPAFLEATPAGLGLYKKFGWEEVQSATVNLKDYGGEDRSCTTVALLRPPPRHQQTL